MDIPAPQKLPYALAGCIHGKLYLALLAHVCYLTLAHVIHAQVEVWWYGHVSRTERDGLITSIMCFGLPSKEECTLLTLCSRLSPAPCPGNVCSEDKNLF